MPNLHAGKQQHGPSVMMGTASCLASSKVNGCEYRGLYSMATGTDANAAATAMAYRPTQVTAVGRALYRWWRI